MNREQRRAAAKQAKQDGNQELSEKITLFGKLGDSCLTCDKPFDKKDKEMATTWNVVVRKEDEDNPVRLYCPECWNTAQEVISNFLKTMEEKNEL